MYENGIYCKNDSCNAFKHMYAVQEIITGPDVWEVKPKSSFSLFLLVQTFWENPSDVAAASSD